jgi:hypothetical protein
VRGLDRRLAGVGITLAGIVLTVASCASHPAATPTPAPTAPTATPTATVPQVRHLGSPIVLQAMVGQPSSPAGGCPAGSAALSGPGAGNGQCYRQLGKPVTFTSAAVSLSQPTNSSGQPPALLITVPASDVSALTAVTTTAADSRGYVDISVAGKTWGIPEAMAPLTTGQFEIGMHSSSQALQLQRILVPSS